MKSLISLIAAIFLVAAVSAQVAFVQPPAMVSNGPGQWTITFEVSQNTDVEVSIVSVHDSAVVRHLAAGVLGAAPPPPFAANALAQTLTWDGYDDFGKPAVHPESLNVRVRAGMTPRLVNLAGENLYDNSGTPTSATDKNGCVYIHTKACGIFSFIRKYDASGNYMKTVFPPPAWLPPDSAVSYGINVVPGGGWVPKTDPVALGGGIKFASMNITRLNAVTDQGRLVFNTMAGQYSMDTNGCFTDPGFAHLPKAPADAGLSPDAGQGPKLAKSAAGYNYGPYVFERLAVDRATDNVYWNGNNKISDWSNPVPYKTPMNLDNITVGPNGFIYGWEYIQWDCPVSRYASDNLHRPVPYGNTGSNRATGLVHFEGAAAGCPGNHRGVGAGWQGQIAAFAEESPLFEVPDTGGSAHTDGNNVIQGAGKVLLSINGYTGRSGDGAIVALSREVMMGVKYDPAGNFYVGVKKHAYPTLVPPGFGYDPAFRNSGSVVKFNADSTGTLNAATAVLTGYERIYPHPFGPFTAVSTGSGTQCTCRSSYFDVDPYGRLYIPNGVACQVYVVDNAGNTISTFGRYGNTDSRGGLSGPGVNYSQPDIPLAWPTSVGASEDFVCVADAVNARLVRVRMVYAIDNIPGLTDHVGLEKKDVRNNIAFTSAPNPFNPESRISVSLQAASRIDLQVYDISGRLVRTLASGQFQAGVYRFTWDARDAAGRSVSAGLYIYQLTAGKRVLMEKAILAK